MAEVVELDDPMSQLHEIFNRFDMDSDGSLTLLELAALLRSLGLQPNGDQIHYVHSIIDANGNGKIEFDELVSCIFLPDGGFNEQLLGNQSRLLAVFRGFDRDGNGVITAAELAGAMSKMGMALSYKELREMIDEADIDGDGVINFQEFIAAMSKSADDFLGIPISSDLSSSPTSESDPSSSLPS